MINWVHVEDALPEHGQWVLAYFPDLPWGKPEDWTLRCQVVQFVCGITKQERDLLDAKGDRRANIVKKGDEHGNNLKPYEWDAFGASCQFGQECTHWAYINKPQLKEKNQ